MSLTRHDAGFIHRAGRLMVTRMEQWVDGSLYAMMIVS